MYNTFSINPAYNTFSYQDISTNNNTIIIPTQLIPPLLGILTEQNTPQLHNENKVINAYKETIAHTINKRTHCTCVSKNILQLINDVNLHNINEIMKKIALFFLINDMVNYYHKEQKDISFHELNSNQKLMSNIYDNYVNFNIIHNDITCDLVYMILQGNQKNHSANIKQAYYMFNTPLPNNDNNGKLIDSIFNIRTILSDVHHIPINLKISSIVNFLDNACFLLPVVKEFCIKVIIVKDGYNIDYDLFYSIEYNEFISFIIEINNLFDFLMRNNSEFVENYIHISNLVNYVLNSVENPRIISEPVSLLYFMILYSFSDNSVFIDNNTVENVVDSINNLLERKDSIALKSLEESIVHYSKNTIPLDMIFSIIN